MVGVVASSWGERASSLLGSERPPPEEIAAKLGQLRQLKEVLLHSDAALLPELVRRLAELQADRAGPVRRALAEMIGEIGLKHMEFLPEVVPTLISFLKDETPAVARQAITSGTFLFQNVLIKVAIQGLHSSEIDDSLKSSWPWMLKFKDAISPIAAQHGSDGVRLLAVRFIEAMVLLYTPDPSCSSSPLNETGDGARFNISWLKGGHPVLNLGDLAMEAGQSLGLLLDQLRFPHVKSLSNSMVIVLINSLSAIARKRPSFYGRILPVLLCLDPASCVIKRVQVPGAYHALKSAFVACLECTHSSAAPWRVRLVEALKAMDASDLVDQAVIKIPGSVNTEEQPPSKDDKLLKQVCDEVYVDPGRKRYLGEEEYDVPQDDVLAGKRLRQTPLIVQETDKEKLKESSDSVHNNLPSDSSMASRNADMGPVQQLVGMFGALVAQGDKAAQSLEILISSISSDLLAEVVMANMRYLPPTCPKADEEEEFTSISCSSSNLVSNNPSVMLSSGFASENFSLSSAMPLIASLLNVQPFLSHNINTSCMSGEEKVLSTVDMAFLPSSAATVSAGVPAPVAPNPPDTENAGSVIPHYADETRTVEGKIPGLESASSFEEIQESVDASHSSAELQGAGQENVISSGSILPVDVSSSSCMSSDVAEVPSPSVAVTDASQAPDTTSIVVSAHYILPKMIVPNINLTDEQKDHLQKDAFIRILEAYKQVAVSGFSRIHFSLLAHLGIEFPLELDSWGLLQKHILSDYLNHQGHELTLHVLYRLYREAEQDQDFLSSRTATSVYETFLLNVAETLRDTFPATDKSLGRLLAEAPFLSEGVFKLLECLCSPGGKARGDKDFQSGDRVTQGLSVVWNLILLRPSNRDRCLQIALQSAVHQLEEVRMKAIRLVANKLYPLSSISQKIENFANKKLQIIVDDLPSTEKLDNVGSILESQKDSDVERPSSGGQPSVSPANEELTSSTQNIQASSISEAQRCMSLYFALCTKKHSLLRQIFVIYERIPKAAKQAVHRHIPILVRTIASSPELLEIISDPPPGSEVLLMQVIQTLTDGAVPSQDLISAIKRLYNFKMKDVEILVPILPFLPKDEILILFPQFVNLPLDKFQATVTRLLQGSPQTGPSLTPAEVLIAIHGIDPEKDGIPLKKVTDACSTCFEQRQVFTQQVLAKVLNQLVEQIPLPLLFMRTVIQAIGVFPGLVDFVMEILSRLVNKQIWKYPKLWVGFLKCAAQTKPQSFNVLLQLPAVQLENALNRNPVLKPPLIEHANQPSIRSTLPRSTLVVLGLVNDPQTSGQAQTSQSQAADTGSSAADVAMEVNQESTTVG